MHEVTGGKHDFLYALRKFRYAQFFAKLAKFRYHSENLLS